MEDKDISEAEYWNKQEKPKKPVALIAILSILCLVIAYLISSFGG